VEKQDAALLSHNGLNKSSEERTRLIHSSQQGPATIDNKKNKIRGAIRKGSFPLMGLMETVEIREEHADFHRSPQARGALAVNKFKVGGDGLNPRR